jgi:hypothetical protein
VPVKVMAATGHPSSCATATLGSVCHCECAGVRHSWGGGFSTEKPPAPGENNGDAPPEPDSGEQVPATFDDRLAAALDGDEARASTPASLVRDDAEALTDAQRAGLEAYLDEYYQPINHILRGGDPSRLRGYYTDEAQVEAWTNGIDEAMAVSTLPDDITVWRGFNGRHFLGEAYNGDLTGMEWREEGYSSTTTSRATAEGFASGDNGTVIRMLVPSGTGAIELSDGSSESEVMLNRGLHLRVVADHGYNGHGLRILDVEVVRDGV